MKPTLTTLIACTLLLFSLKSLSAATDDQIEQTLMARVSELFTNGQVITHEMNIIEWVGRRSQ